MKAEKADCPNMNDVNFRVFTTAGHLETRPAATPPFSQSSIVDQKINLCTSTNLNPQPSTCRLQILSKPSDIQYTILQLANSTATTNSFVI
jgi:hypothetical protein